MLARFQESLSCVAPLTRKYRFMEMTTAQRRQGLEQKIPDISKTLDMVRLLKKRRVRRPC